MIILTRLAANVEAYLQRLKSAWWHQMHRCPHCRGRLQGHGSYQRYADERDRCEKIPVRRRRCPRCRKTFSYPPHFLRPYRSLLVAWQQRAALLWALGSPCGAWVNSWGGLWTPSAAMSGTGRTRHRRSCTTWSSGCWRSGQTRPLGR